MTKETVLPPRAVVLLSGGLDSATALAIAIDEGFECIALSFDYGQRHEIELQSARRVAAALGASEHRIVKFDLRQFGRSALTDNIDVPKNRPLEKMCSEIPVTYVPARNTIFLSFALALAEVSDCRDIFIGVNALDYSGYPDCRPSFIEKFQEMAKAGTKAGAEGGSFYIHTPLISMTKAEIIQRGVALGVDYSLTLSCYDPDDRGRHCGACDSCLLRRKGFQEANVQDPTNYVTLEIRP
ncbi:MAG: 7-cyano-7-deazaguanine synthase QueC [Candidatus Omnitrophota bacterium]